MADARPEVIFVAAAKVGGIAANAAHPADFLYANTLISMNIMKTAADIGVEKLLWMGFKLHLSKIRGAADQESAF